MASILSLVATLLLCLNIHKGLALCPTGWKFQDDSSSCYLFSEGRESWMLASAHCRALGGHLATIETEKEHRFLRGEVINVFHGLVNSTNYWLDGTDYANEAQWIWALKESPITGYSNWCPGQPADDGDHRDCLVLWGQCDFRWNDQICTSRHHFICEKTQSVDPGSVIG